jgi:hypothetical protein
MNQPAVPSNYLQSPLGLTSGTQPVRVGKSTYMAPQGTRVKMTTRSGKPVAHILTPAGQLHELHQLGERRLSPSEQKRLKSKHFPQ